MLSYGQNCGRNYGLSIHSWGASRPHEHWGLAVAPSRLPAPHVFKGIVDFR